MKNIRRIADIKAEKMKLRIKELELEKEIRQNWKELKVELRPDTFLRNKILHYTHQKEEEENFLSSAISFGVSYLTKKLTEKMVEKVALKIR